MNPYWNHLKTITRHKFIVMSECFKCGQIIRGLMHDNSKFGPTEFFSSARNFQGTRSPIDVEKEKRGYSLAWQHHKGHNPHHWEYWIDNVGTRTNTPIKVPYEYVIEMLCDWIGAGKVYSKDHWTNEEPYTYYMRVRDKRIIHPETENLILFLLETIRDYDLEMFHIAARSRSLREGYEKGETLPVLTKL